MTWKRRSPVADYWNYELLSLGDYTLSAGRLTVAVAFALAGLIISRIAAWLAYRWLDRRFDLSAGADRAALRAIKVVIVLIGFYLAVENLGVGRFGFGQIQDSELTVSGVFLALIIVWVTWNVSQVAAELADQWIADLGISRSLATLITNLTRALVIFIGFYIAASSLGFDLNVGPAAAVGARAGAWLRNATHRRELRVRGDPARRAPGQGRGRHLDIRGHRGRGIDRAAVHRHPHLRRDRSDHAQFGPDHQPLRQLGR